VVGGDRGRDRKRITTMPTKALTGAIRTYRNLSSNAHLPGCGGGD